MNAQGRPTPIRDTHPALDLSTRCQDRPVHPECAALVGRVQATLIGAGRLGVAFAGDPQSALLLTISARALGSDRVTLLIDPTRHAMPATDHLSQVVAAQLGLPVICVTGTGSPGRTPRDLPVDSIAYCDIPDAGASVGVPVRALDDRRVLYPFAMARLTHADIATCARALGLQAGEPRAYGTGS